MKLFILGALFSFSALAAECVSMMKNQYGLEEVCIGDSAVTIDTQEEGKIIDIDTSAFERNENAEISIQIEKENGEKIRLDSDEFALIVPGLCSFNSEICMGAEYKDKYSGRNMLVFGVNLGILKVSGYDLVVKDMATHKLEASYSEKILTSLAFMKAGEFEDVGSCIEGLLPQFESTLTKCAIKNMNKNAKKLCEKHNGKARMLTETLETKCGEKFNLLPPHDTYCKVKATYTCN